MHTKGLISYRRSIAGKGLCGRKFLCACFQWTADAEVTDQLADAHGFTHHWDEIFVFDEDFHGA